jgi:hypothetical protein
MVMQGKLIVAAIALAAGIGFGIEAPVSAQTVEASVTYRCAINGVQCPGGNAEYSSATGAYSSKDVIERSNGNRETQTAPYAWIKSRAAFGSLGGAAESNLPVGFGGQVLADMALGWSDVFTVRSNTLESNLPVSVRFTAVVDLHNISILTSSDQFFSPEAFSGIQYQGYAGNAGLQLCSDALLFACQGSSQLSTGLALGRNILSRDHVFRVDVPMSVGDTLSLYTGGLSNNQGNQSAFASVDAFNTARTYVEVLTPGAFLETASGHNYALPLISAVPEPATWSMMIAGFGLIGGTMRRRKERLAFAV